MSGRIVQIRGTSGSGKSTLARIVLDSLIDKCAVKIEGRRQPLLYTGKLPPSGDRPNGTRVAVLGHYETACGGVDTITKRAQAFELARDYGLAGYVVIMEGVILSDEVPHTVQLNNEVPVRVLHLDVPLEDCLNGIGARRVAKGNTKPIDPANTRKRIPAIRKACARLSQSGVQVVNVDRATGPAELVLAVFGGPR